ncbi:MAG: hypothetical protein NTZ18_03830 [Candidatus Komeilibacteria bacterium]|nr:hypothetical protein [Candidatus Komeilibacteria bacterium]
MVGGGVENLKPVEPVREEIEPIKPPAKKVYGYKKGKKNGKRKYKKAEVEETLSSAINYKCQECNKEFKSNLKKWDATCPSCNSIHCEEMDEPEVKVSKIKGSKRRWTDEDDKRIKSLKDSGMSIRKIADEFGVTEQAVSNRYYKSIKNV